MEHVAKTRSRSYFDQHRRSPLANIGYWNHDYKYTLTALDALMPRTLVDIGCGPGAFLERAHERLPHTQLHALDLSKGMVERTAERLGGAVRAVVGDAEAMPFASNQFAAVTCNMSIHHYPHPQAALREMLRILEPSGSLLLNDMDCVAPIRAVANKVFPRLPGGDVKMYTRSEIVQMLQAAGFRDLRYQKVSPFSFLCIARKPQP